MPSILPGFEYDIFISYRQKDNKYDGWVTEFVANLKKELEATFKEDISIYFDENPHDGLLETHNVDKSLEGKLKSIVFIPILSQTYCDPKSFAWHNEFLVFCNLCREDQYGLDIKLHSGNVGSRILPVRIHDLDSHDQKLVEQEIGPIRGIEFIFKAQGVNRPLAPTDNPDKSINHTFYRDQLNKVANAVREIISSLGPGGQRDAEQIASEINRGDRVNKENQKRFFNSFKVKRIKLDKKKFFRISWILLTALLVALASWGWLRSFVVNKNEIPATYSFIPTENPIPLQAGNLSISPDGQAIVFGQPQGIYIQNLNDFKTTHLNGTQRANNPVFSPNGQLVAYNQNGILKKYDLQTGITTEITTMGGTLFWGSDNKIYFDSGSGSDGIWSVSDAGGTPVKITYVNDNLGEVDHRWPQLLPDKRTLIYTALGASDGRSEDSKIVGERLETDDRVTLVEKAIYGRYLSNGNLLYAVSSGSIYVIPLSIEKLEVTGSPVVVLSDVQTGGGRAFLSVSETGNLVFVPRNQRPSVLLVTRSSTGKTTNQTISLDSIISKRAGYGWGTFSISPTGGYALLTGRAYSLSDIWLIDIMNGDSERLTFDIAQDEFPVWSPKGKFFAYTSARRRLYIKEVSGGKTPSLIWTWPRHIHFTSWSPDSLFLAAYDYAPSSTDVWAISVDGKDSIAVAKSDASESGAVFSPDGKWLAYHSNESGRFEIYVVSFPTLAVKKQISVGGGGVPRWGKDGKAIFFLQGNHVVKQEVETRNEFIKGKMEVLFEISADDFDVSPDGEKFYLLVPNTTKDHKPLHLITNWFEVIKTKLSEK